MIACPSRQQLENLQNRGSGQSAMGEHHRLAEGVFAAAGRHVQRNAAQRLHEGELGAGEFQGNQRRPRLRQRQAELRGQSMRQAGGAHLGNR